MSRAGLGAYRAGSLPIGAAVVDRDGRLVGRGRNRVFETLAEPADTRCLFGHRLAHAEMNALVDLDHAAVDVRECVLYTTLEPCALCVGAIRMPALKDVRYAARAAAAGSLALLDTTDFMRRGPVEQHAKGVRARWRACWRPIRPGLPEAPLRCSREEPAKGENLHLGGGRWRESYCPDAQPTGTYGRLYFDAPDAPLRPDLACPWCGAQFRQGIHDLHPAERPKVAPWQPG